jgi:formylglycine-generating enzyme required for sulfatase activity
MKNECDRLHTELDALRKHANELESINEQLNHKEVDEVEHLKQELTQTKNDRERLEKRVHQLEKVKPNGGKNKWIAYSLLLVVFTCVGLVWYSLSDKTKSHVEPKSSNTANVDSLQQTRSFAVNGVLFKMIFVKGGTFKMGCDSGGEDERPLNSVTVSDFYMGEFEVTQSLWQEVMGTNIYQQRDKEYTGGPMFGVGSNYPMYYVSHTEAEEFCEQLNQQVRNQLPSGYFFTLPTEAQWEYAAKGGDKSKSYTYSGGNHLSDVGWYDNNSSASTNTVGLKVPNELGLYDMSGNVWEWCADWYESYSSSEKKDPMGPSSGLYRVLRGGSWGSSASGCRITRRGYLSPNSRYNYGGFRLVLARR